MRVLQLLTDTNIGGAGVCIENYILAKSSDIDCITALPKGGLMARRINDIGGSVIEPDIKGDSSFALSDIGKYIKLIKSISPDIVHTHGCLTGRIAAKMLGIKTVYTKHTLGGRRMAAVNGAVTDIVIAVSNEAAKELISGGMSSKKVRVVLNGCKGVPEMDKGEARKVFGLKERDIVATCVARLEEVKNHRELIKAAKLVAEQVEGFKLLLVGGGSLEGELKALATDCVIFAGQKGDVTDAYRAADIFALVSLSENLPLTLVEAMSAKLPCLLTAVGGIPEVATGKTAVFTKHDSQDIARNLVDLCLDKQKRAEMGEAGFELYNEGFTLTKYAEGIENVYRELVHGE